MEAPEEADPGSVFVREIREQPAALRRLLEHEADYADVARILTQRPPSLVRLAAHGSSDNAASYAIYAFGLLPGWTALRDSITLSVYYGAELDLGGSVVVALSQSGRTPDVVDYVERARARGALTIALTNDPSAELAAAAELTLPLAAGAERAVAATKTYLNQLAGLVLLAGHVAGRGAEVADGLRAVADMIDGILDPLARATAEVALPFAWVGTDVRHRPWHRVRNRQGGRPQADRDVPRGSRAADGNGSRARAGRSARSLFPVWTSRRTI